MTAGPSMPTEPTSDGNGKGSSRTPTTSAARPPTSWTCQPRPETRALGDGAASGGGQGRSVPFLAVKTRRTTGTGPRARCGRRPTAAAGLDVLEDDLGRAEEVPGVDLVEVGVAVTGEDVRERLAVVGRTGRRDAAGRPSAIEGVVAGDEQDVAGPVEDRVIGPTDRGEVVRGDGRRRSRADRRDDAARRTSSFVQLVQRRLDRPRVDDLQAAGQASPSGATSRVTADGGTRQAVAIRATTAESGVFLPSRTPTTASRLLATTDLVVEGFLAEETPPASRPDPIAKNLPSETAQPAYWLHPDTPGPRWSVATALHERAGARPSTSPGTSVTSARSARQTRARSSPARRPPRTETPKSTNRPPFSIAGARRPGRSRLFSRSRLDQPQAPRRSIPCVTTSATGPGGVEDLADPPPRAVAIVTAELRPEHAPRHVEPPAGQVAEVHRQEGEPRYEPVAVNDGRERPAEVGAESSTIVPRFMPTPGYLPTAPHANSEPATSPRPNPSPCRGPDRDQAPPHPRGPASSPTDPWTRTTPPLSSPRVRPGKAAPESDRPASPWNPDRAAGLKSRRGPSRPALRRRPRPCRPDIPDARYAPGRPADVQRPARHPPPDPPDVPAVTLKG